MLKVDPDGGRRTADDGIRSRPRESVGRRAARASDPAPQPVETPAERPRTGRSAPRRVRPGHRLLGLPLRTIMALELALGAVLVGLGVEDPNASLAAFVVAGLALLGAPASHGVWFGTPWLRRTTFGVRRHGAPRPEQDEDAAPVDTVAEGVRSLFPGLTMHSATNRAGLHFGGAVWGEHLIAALEIEQRASASSSTRMDVPLAAVAERCREAEIPVHSIALLRTVRSGRPDADSEVLRGIQGELAERGEFSRSRTYLVIRLDPRTAAAAIAMRGGDQLGEDAALASLLARSASVMTTSGLVGRQLSVGDLREALEDSLFPGRVGPDADQPATWVERWDAITTPSHRHLVMSADSWKSGAGVVSMSPREVTDLDLALEVLDPVNTPLSRVTVRITAPSGASTRSLRKSLGKAASGLGVGLQTLGGAQAPGLRSTTLIGEGH